MAFPSPLFTSAFCYTDSVQKEGVKQTEKKLCKEGEDYRQNKLRPLLQRDSFPVLNEC